MNVRPRRRGKPEIARVMASEFPPLTEAELLAMPDADYMNAAQTAFFRTRLQQLRKDLLANAAVTSQHLQQNETSADPNDRATAEEERLLELRVRDRERKWLGKIDARRIDTGEYGYCEETGEPIGLRRLLARPTATLCIETQEQRERLQNRVAD